MTFQVLEVPLHFNVLENREKKSSGKHAVQSAKRVDASALREVDERRNGSEK